MNGLLLFCRAAGTKCLITPKSLISQVQNILLKEKKTYRRFELNFTFFFLFCSFLIEQKREGAAFVPSLSFAKLRQKKKKCFETLLQY